MDASGSIHEDRFVAANDFLKGVAMDLPTYSGGRVAFLTFSEREKLYFNFEDYTSRTQVGHIHDIFFDVYMYCSLLIFCILIIINITLFY